MAIRLVVVDVDQLLGNGVVDNNVQVITVTVG
jgi:hypothetical protein